MRMFRAGLLAVVICAPVVAEKEGAPGELTSVNLYPHAVGAFGSLEEDLMVGYRKWNGRSGWQGGFGVFLNSEEWQDPMFSYSVGGQLMVSVFARDLREWLNTQFYLFAGAGHGGYIPVDTYYEEEEEEEEEGDLVRTVGDFTPTLRASSGGGIEVTIFSHFSFVFQLGYLVRWDASGSDLLSQIEVIPVPQTSFFFRF